MNPQSILFYLIIGLSIVLFLPKEKVEIMSIENLERSTPILFANGFKTQVIWEGLERKHETDSNLIATMRTLNTFTKSQINRIEKGQSVSYNIVIQFFEQKYGELKKVEFWITNLPTLEPIFDHPNIPITSLEKAIFKNWLVGCYITFNQSMIQYIKSQYV